MTAAVEVLEFDDLSVPPQEVLAILRAAAAGDVPVRDVWAAQNPDAWALAFAHAVYESALRPALTAATEKLLASSVLHEAELGVSLQDRFGLVGENVLWSVLFEQAAAGRRDQVLLAASALTALAAVGRATVDDRVLAWLEQPELAPVVRKELLALAGTQRRDWLLDHIAVVQGASDKETLHFIGAVAIALGSEALESFARLLQVRFTEAGTPLPAETVATIAAMVAARRNAGR